MRFPYNAMRSDRGEGATNTGLPMLPQLGISETRFVQTWRKGLKALHRAVARHYTVSLKSWSLSKRASFHPNEKLVT